jgi:hypothetical protein
MAELNEEGIKKLIERYKATYIGNPSILLSGYSQENQTVADYEGRQLLELMQNADDAKSDIVYIALDTQKQELTVSNNGEPFSLDGVESLMYTGLSTKNKTEYIGNKGLGFRSILSWVNWVEVRTKNVSFRFSKTYAERFFKKYLLGNLLIEERIEKEKAEKRLNTDEIPIATLAFPDLLTDKETKFTTSIVLQFKVDELKYIEEQIAVISEETLLFLPNIRKIEVLKDGELVKSLHKDVDEEHLITINNKTWNIYRKPDQVYKNVKYNYAIVWQNDLTNTGYFYNYFPTDVETNLPCIIHATFDLTNNRKEINKTAANKHILDCVVESLGDIVSKHLKYETPDWDAYLFLNPIFDNNRPFFKVFYNKISDKREEIGCYPTLDGNYLPKKEAIYHGDVFSEWVLRNDLGSYFMNLLLPLGIIKICTSNRYTFTQFRKIVDKINLLLTIKTRTELIHHLAIKDTEWFSNIINNIGKLPLLLDTQGDVVSSDIQVFTKDTDLTEFEIPGYIGDIAFISNDLYASLGIELQKEIKEAKLETENGDSRAIKRLIDSFVNIGSDDITDVIQHIVSLTNREIKVNKEPQNIVKQMVALLYFMFNSKNNTKGKPTTVKKIPLLSRAGTIVYSEDLYFGKEYTNGAVAEEIFKGIRVATDYLADNTIWSKNNSVEDITSFFKWLNVNLYSKYEKIDKKLGRYDYEDDYVNYLFTNVDHSRKDVYKTYSVESISGIEYILKHPIFTLEKLISWVSKDELFLNKLHLRNNDVFFTNFGPEQRDYTEKPSYLTFIIYNSGITKNVIAEIPGGHLDNIQSINFKHPLLEGLQNYKILEILDLLHIKSSFNELQPENVYTLIRSFGSIDNIKKSQQVYKLFYEYFKVNEETQLKDYNLELDTINYVCRKGGIGKSFEIKSNSEVYYSDNKMLPQKILDRYWFINLPKRIGENRVQTFFGVKLIKDISSNIQTTGIEDNNLNVKLETYINQLKVYLLCYRLGSQKKEDNKEEIVRSIKTFKVQLVKKAKFKLGDEAYSELEDCEFIPQDKSFLIKYGKESDLKDLQNDRFFCDAITEMLCITFKVNDLKDIFWRIFKNGIGDVSHNLISDEKVELLEEAKKLLGISNDEKSFWTKILKRDLSDIEDADLLRSIIKNKLKTSLIVGYMQVDFSNLKSNKGIEFLKWLNNIKPFDLNKIIQSGDLTNYHQENIEEIIRDIDLNFKKLLWKKANDSTNLKDKKEFFKQLTELEPEFKKGAFKHFLQENQYQLEPNYKVAVFQYVLVNFGIDLKKIPDPTILIETRYKALFRPYTFGIDVEDMEKIIKETTPKIYSYLYFEGFEEEIKKALELQQADKDKDSHDTDNGIDTSNLSLMESDMLCVEPMGTGNPGRNGGSHNSKGDRKKAIAGKREEDKVVNSLKQNGFKVRHVSKTTDRKHYDIEYKKANEAWRFLEVKKDSGGYFFMSKYEKETALSDKAREKYDIAIVNNNNIHIIKNPFNFKDEETFEVNSKFYAESTEFKISFEINIKGD